MLTETRTLNSTPPPVPSKASRPVRMGIVGLGFRSISGVLVEEIVPAFRDAPESFELVALCDNDAQKRNDGARKVGDGMGSSPQLFASHDEMFEKAELDAVYVAGPNYLHAPMALSAFRQGIDVLCEKPVATTLVDADRMNAEAEANGCLLAFFMQMHYRRRYHRVAELIQSGRIGEPVMTWCTEFRGPFPEWMKWIPDRKKSGGALVEKNCHHCDILDLWVGSRPVSVYAMGGQMKHHVLAGQPSDLIDHAWISFDYENGTKGMIGINFTQNHRHQRELGVAGTEGVIRFSLADGEKLHVTTNDDDTEILDCPGDLRGGVFRDFLRCVRTRRQPLVTFERGRRSLLVPLAAEKSLVEKRPVLISEIDPPEAGKG